MIACDAGPDMAWSVPLLQRSLFYYLKGNHSFLRMYRTRAATLDLPRSVFILVFSIFFQLMLCIELTRGAPVVW